MALARECDSCGAAWPDSPQFALCPRCQVRCRTAIHAHPMTNGEAQNVLSHLKFQRFYAQHEEKRARLGRPTPEEIGMREAFELIKGWHEVRLKLGKG